MLKLKLDDHELQLLTNLHEGVTVPIPDAPWKSKNLCKACGYDMPCPTLRLIEEVKELRKTDYAYGSSLHDGSCGR